MFDFLFRKHLQNIYLLLDDTPPPELSRPISRSGPKVTYTSPRAFLDVKIDGHSTFFEWISAGHYVAQNERGTMAQATQGLLADVYFGFDLDRLFLRIDSEGPARSVLAACDVVRISFAEPAGYELLVRAPGQPGQCVELSRNNQPLDAADILIAVDQIMELAVPFDRIGLAIHGPVRFFVELLRARKASTVRRIKVTSRCPARRLILSESCGMSKKEPIVPHGMIDEQNGRIAAGSCLVAAESTDAGVA